VSNCWIYNNVFCYESLPAIGFTLTTNSFTGVNGQNDEPILFGADNGQPVQWVNIVVANNTIVDCLSQAPVLGFNTYQYSGQTLSNCIIANNLIYDSMGNAIPALEVNASSTNGCYIGYNYIYSGVSGNAGWTNEMMNGFVPQQIPADCNNQGTCTVAPQFVSYSQLSSNNNFALATNDTACTGQGTNLSAYFTNNITGASRPSTGPWNIGAY
jgi:hypothetical protein